MALLLALKPDRSGRGSHCCSFESESRAERNRGRKTRELVDYREAASQRDWWEKRVRIKLHKNPKLREGDAKNDIRMASSRTAGDEKMSHG